MGGWGPGPPLNIWGGGPDPPTTYITTDRLPIYPWSSVEQTKNAPKNAKKKKTGAMPFGSIFDLENNVGLNIFVQDYAIQNRVPCLLLNFYYYNKERKQTIQI